MTPCFARLGLLALVSIFALDALAQAPTPTPLPTNPPPPQQQPNAPVAAPVTPAPIVPAAPARPAPAAPADDPMVTLKLPDADIDTILTALEIYTGRTVLRPAQLPTATFNLKIADPIPRSQAILAIETVLALNNIGVTPQGDRFLIVTQLPMTKTTAPEMITGSAFSLPPSGKIAMKVFQLEFLRAAEFQPIIQPLLNPNAGAAVIVLQNANAMMITDSVSNLQRVETLIEQLDRPVSAGMKPKFYTLQEARASDLVQKLRTILQGTLQTQLGSATSYQADDRTNQIILVTDPRQYPFFDELIEKLDIRADPNTRNDVIRLNHSKAADLVSVLSRVISGQTQASQRQNTGSVRPGQIQQPNVPQPVQPGAPPPAQPVVNDAAVNAALEGFGGGSAEFSPLMTVAPDERSNSVVVSGTANDLRLIRDLIAKLDVVLAQVRIEVVIAEVTLTDNHQTGIDQLGLKVDGDKLVGFLGSSPSVVINGPDGSENSFATITRPGTSGGWDLAGTIFVGTTPRKDNAAILSVPSITTSHAKEATVFVGETRPIISGSVNSGIGGGTTSTTTQQQIGINLKVTPLIGANGSVQLDVQQDVDEVGPDVIIDGNPVPIIFKRTTASFVSVQSGEIVVLGGLQRQRNSKSSNRLGPIPIIGDIFGSRTRNKSRTELIFFLRPHILTNTPADNASALKRVDELPQKDEIRRHIDPSYVPEKKNILDKILPH